MVTLTGLLDAYISILTGTLGLGVQTGLQGAENITGIDVPGLGTTAPLAAADPDPEHKAKPVFILGTAAVLGGMVAAPLLYKAYTSRLRGKKAKRAAVLGAEVETASNRAVMVAASLLPALGLPIAYIGIQELEARGTISKGLGDSVQALIAAGAVAPAIGGITGLISKVK